MTDSRTSKEKLPDWLRRWYALKGELRFREAADEIERLLTLLDRIGVAYCKTHGTEWQAGCYGCSEAQRLTDEPPAAPIDSRGIGREPFVVKHYSEDERPSIKGNGFDGLQVGEDRQEAEEFIAWLNARLTPPPEAWRSALLDKPTEADGPVVLVFTGEAYSVEYPGDVNGVEHIAWRRITPYTRPTKRADEVKP
jgi:hypothetical protein